jgi:hypothetical protein
MLIDGYMLMADSVTKFFNTIRVFGWFHHPDDALTSVAISGAPVIGCIAEIGLPHGGVASLGPNRGFCIQFLRPHEAFDDAASVVFTTASGWSTEVPLLTLCADRALHFTTGSVATRFIDAINTIPGARVLDIGGRDRSQVDRQNMTKADCTVLDILPGDNVDVVADAHDMARIFPAEHFDGIFSVSVFEHLLMPWAVVVQMNHVLKTHGLAMIFSHQTLGVHDAPWDFWRFSDNAWDALFNRFTGFEILERAVDREQFILPFIYSPIKAHAERAAGHEGSVVLARKIGPCQLSWNVKPADLTSTMYPSGTENPYEKK